MKKTIPILTNIAYLIALFYFSCPNSNAQCSITSNTNASTLSCGSAPLSGCKTVYIGNGTNNVTLTMDSGLNLTCLGPIQLIVKNKAAIDFSPGNNRLTLADGSSISFESGSTLTGGSCNASERILIGSTIIASCNGNVNSTDLSFTDLLNQGGYNSIDVTSDKTSVCGSGSVTLTATAKPTTGATIKWYTSATGGSAIASGSTYSPTISATTTYYVEAQYSSYTTTRTAITITLNTLPAITAQPTTPTATCSGTGTQTLSVSATGTGLTYSWRKSGNALINGSVISGQGTATLSLTNPLSTDGGSYDVVVSGTCAPAVTSNLVAVTVNPNLPVSLTIVPSSNPACLGASVTFTATPTNGGSAPTYQWKLNGTAVGTNSATYTNSGLTNGNTISCTLTSNATCASGSPASSSTTTMTINSLPAAPTIGTITQPSCIVTGSVVLNGLPSGNWTINPGNITGSGTSTTVSGLQAGTNNFTVTDSYGCLSSQSQNVNILGTSIKRWAGVVTGAASDWFNDSNWIPSGVPTANDCVTIPSNVPMVSISDTSKIAYANTLSLTNTGNLEVKSGNILIVTNSVNVDTGGTFTLHDGSNLIQINSATNSGNIIASRNSTPVVLNDYTYWSSPTWGSQTLSNFSPNSNPKYFLSYSNGWKYLNASSTVFDKGIGYALLSPKGTSLTVPASISFQFYGTPNNGTINVQSDYDASVSSSKLIGNPYPSALDADKFILANLEGTGTINKTITGTLYFWTHNHSFANGTYSSDDYATYNLTGGTGTGTSATTSGSGAGNSTMPTRWIASGQGFIVETKASGNITFTNEMRTNGTGYVNSNFYKNANIAQQDLEKNRIWLNLTTEKNNFSQILIGYIETATNTYDPGFDGTYNSNSKIGLYSLIDKNNYTIQGRALPFTEKDIVPLGYKTDTAGNMTISIDSVDGLFSGNQDIYIEDKLLNIIHNLKLLPYTFNTQIGTFNDRFILRYNDATLGLDDPKNIGNNVIISSKNQQVKIQSTMDNIAKVFVYDMLGRAIYKNSEIEDKEILISNLKAQQVLIVNVILNNGQLISKKIVL